MNIIIFGDSITWGAWDPKGGWAFRLKSHADRITLQSHFEQYISVHPLGVSGDTSTNLLKRIEPEYKARHKPDDTNIVILAIGINDSVVSISDKTTRVPLDTFRQNIKLIFERLDKYVDRFYCLGLTSVDESRVYPMRWGQNEGYSNEQIEIYNDALRNICTEKNVAFIDVYNNFIGKEAKLLEDGVHPNEKGHTLMYENVLTSVNSML
jgi:lysophospholipase L1-like esterase